MNIVSGYANGVDLAAHQAALSAGGVTTMVLAEGILKFRSKHDLAHLFDEDNHLILSEFPPRLPWSVHNAMHRNRVVCALSDSVVVIEAGLSGGTFAAAEKTLQLRRPLFVVDYANPPPSAEGNRHFLGKGAIPLRRDREGKANLQPVLDVILGTRAVTQSKAATMRLFDLPDDGKRASAEPARHKEPAA
jgi:DNA processing protein